jgi:hAT family protein
LASSERYFSQGALNINKLRNRLNKDTFNIIMCLKSWGLIIEEEKEAKAIELEENIREEARFIY